jgi:RNA polymerase sigma-70 factor (ECF subfamily)
VDEDKLGPPPRDRGAPKEANRAGELSRETLEKIRERHPEALGLLFDRHFRRLYNLVLRLLGNRESAEDAIQEVFLRVYQKAEQLDPERDPGPWLTTIALNVCRAQWRSARTRMHVQSRSLDTEPSLSETLSQAGPGPDESALRAEQRDLLLGALAQLPQPQREVVILHDFENLGHDEIAGMTGMSHAAVRKRYSRALDKMRHLLKGRWP